MQIAIRPNIRQIPRAVNWSEIVFLDSTKIGSQTRTSEGALLYFMIDFEI